MPKGKGSAQFPVKLFFYIATALVIIGAVASIVAFFYNLISVDSANLLFTIALSLFLSCSVISYLFSRGKKPKQIIKELGLSRKSLSLKMVAYGLTLFAIYIVLVLAISAISSLTNIQISSNVQQAIGNYPLWAIIFVSFIAPINEEIAFRGFLVPRIGVIASGIVFAVLHFGYGSFVEIFMALWFGLAGGYVFKKTKSLYPSLITHMMVNAITGFSIFAMMHGPIMAILVH